MRKIYIEIWGKEDYLAAGTLPAIGIRIEAQKAGGERGISLLATARKSGGRIALARFLPYTAPLSPGPGMARQALSMPLRSGATQCMCLPDAGGRQLVLNALSSPSILSIQENDIGEFAGMLGERDWLILLKQGNKGTT